MIKEKNHNPKQYPFISSIKVLIYNSQICFNSFPTIHDNYRLLSLLPMYFGILYIAYKMDPYQSASFNSSNLMRVLSVCFHMVKLFLSAFGYVQQMKQVDNLFRTPTKKKMSGCGVVDSHLPCKPVVIGSITL